MAGYTTRAFMQLELGDALTRRDVTLHIFEWKEHAEWSPAVFSQKIWVAFAGGRITSAPDGRNAQRYKRRELAVML